MRIAVGVDERDGKITCSTVCELAHGLMKHDRNGAKIRALSGNLE